jgi:FkbM family methyltransferase
MTAVGLRPSITLAIAYVRKLLSDPRLAPSIEVEGNPFYLDPSTDIGHSLLTSGGFEEHEITACRKYIRNDGIVLDIGANIGLHSVHFARVAEFGKVISVEASRSTFATLLRNTVSFPNVIPLNVALSDTNGTQTFYVARDNAYSGLKNTRRKPIVHTEQVACYSGDHILAPLIQDSKVDLIKIDVEGHETQVLAGLKAIISKHKPVIFCEIFGGEHSNADPQATIQFCVGLGYIPYVLDGGSLILAARHDDRRYNYFFVPSPIDVRY